MPAVVLQKAARVVGRAGVVGSAQLVTVCACLVALLVHAFFTPVFDIPYLSILFWVFLGLSASLLDRSRQRSIHAEEGGLIDSVPEQSPVPPEPEP
jgi:hypothetical protein